MQHSARLRRSAWSKQIERRDGGRPFLAFSELARPVAALVVTGLDEQLAHLVENESTALAAPVSAQHVLVPT